MVRGRWTAPAALALVVLAVPASARADGKPYLEASRSARPLTSAVKSDRASLVRRLGPQAVLDVDAATGTPRVLAKLNGALAGPASGSPEAIADAYVRSHLSALGLTQADLDTLQPPEVTTSPAGISQVRRRQAVGGVQAADAELRVAVAKDGSVLSVLGAPAHGLSLASTTPALDAGEAVRKVQADAGVFRSVAPTRGGRTATFSDGTRASLVLFAGRLAWDVSYRAASDVVYDTTVDADSGRILRRVNMVKSDASASVWQRFPGNGLGGAAQTVDLAPWLNGGAAATTLDGTNVLAWSDLNDATLDNNPVDHPDPGETIGQNGGTFAWPLVAFTPNANCDAAHTCSWDGTAATRTRNRQQDGVQAFYFANVFHDHLAAPPIGFGSSAGDHPYEGAGGRLLLEADDGASTGPDANHVNNANMYTPPAGQHPVMQMYLWNGSERYVNGGDDADIVFHEYTHGLSSRLVTDAAGNEALNAPQAGALGEAWSDWYAEDFIVSEFPSLHPDLGAYTDYPGGGKIRSQPMDCPVAGAPVTCGGGATGHSGGYTYADFGRVGGGPEVHADGEIWGETLWDIRTALGSAKAERLITEGLRITPPEPTFLDARNAILQADTAVFGGADRAALWQIFATRGMGFYAAATSSVDTSPIADFSLPPADNGPKGTISGRVTSADSGLPLPSASVGVGGFLTPGALPGATLTGTSDGSGAYQIGGVPFGTYPRLVFSSPGYDTETDTVTLENGTPAPVRNMALRRDWSSLASSAQITGTTGTSYPGCEPDFALDGDPTTGWSAPRPSGATVNSFTVQLPATIDISAFGMNPTETCQDPHNAAAAHVQVDTSPDGVSWSRSLDYTFTDGDRHHISTIAPTGASTGVRYVRLTLLTTQVGAYPYQDFTEFEVYGAPPNVLPSGSLSATPSGASAHFTAQMSDPDSAITGYSWDFGDGTTASTPGPETDHAYAQGGTYRATVAAQDFRGGAGTASTTVSVGNPAATPTPVPPAPTPTPAPATLAKPSFTLPSSGSKGSLTFTVACAAACSTTASLTVDAKTKRKLGLATVGTRSFAVKKAGKTRISVTLSAKALRALKRHKLKSVVVTLKVTARYADGTVASSSRRSVKLKLA